METLESALRGVLASLRTHAEGLFDDLAENAALDRQGGIRGASVHTHLAALDKLDAELGAVLGMAATHQANEARIAPLLKEIQARDTLQRTSIAKVASLRAELHALVLAADAERDEMQHAEDDPLDYHRVLAYAQRLARYTSAPPGYRLEPPEAPAADDAPLHLAPEYNQKAARAAGYYDPAIPPMPQELPFPSDRLMRQGILYADAAGGVPPPEAPAPVQETIDAAPAPAPAALDTFAMDDEDAFDLDLNP